MSETVEEAKHVGAVTGGVDSDFRGDDLIEMCNFHNGKNSFHSEVISKYKIKLKKRRKVHLSPDPRQRSNMNGLLKYYFIIEPDFFH